MKRAKRTLLVVEDDDGLRRQLRWAFNDWDVTLVGDREAALERVQEEHPQIVLLDLGLPPDADGPTEGLATLEQIIELESTTKTIVMSGQREREHEVRAVGIGAYDFYEKPIEIDVLSLVIDRAFRVHGLEAENRALLAAKSGETLPGVITVDPKMIEICNEIRTFAPIDVAVLLVGESGTGKELLARAIHELSPREDKPFIAINCAAIPENLLESELFGHERGAFTGAIKMKLGKVEVAKGGTLFLDEIGDLPLSLQAKLLRFLQERVIQRVGGNEDISVDIRLVAATNKDLSQVIGSKEFREDLYYRLSEATIHIPPLRDRPEDAVLLAQNIRQQLSEQLGRNLADFTTEALAAIGTYLWPGNVRELQNRVKRALVSHSGPRLTAEDLALHAGDSRIQLLTLKDARDQASRNAIRSAMTATNGNISETARVLDISRPTLYQLLKEYNFKV